MEGIEFSRNLCTPPRVDHTTDDIEVHYREFCEVRATKVVLPFLSCWTSFGLATEGIAGGSQVLDVVVIPYLT